MGESLETPVMESVNEENAAEVNVPPLKKAALAQPANTVHAAVTAVNPRDGGSLERLLNLSEAEVPASKALNTSAKQEQQEGQRGEGAFIEQPVDLPPPSLAEQAQIAYDRNNPEASLIAMRAVEAAKQMAVVRAAENGENVVPQDVLKATLSSKEKEKFDRGAEAIEKLQKEVFAKRVGAMAPGADKVVNHVLKEANN